MQRKWGRQQNHNLCIAVSPGAKPEEFHLLGAWREIDDAAKDAPGGGASDRTMSGGFPVVFSPADHLRADDETNLPPTAAGYTETKQVRARNVCQRWCRLPLAKDGKGRGLSADFVNSPPGDRTVPAHRGRLFEKKRSDSIVSATD